VKVVVIEEVGISLKMTRYRFTLMMPILAVAVTSVLWLSARAQYRTFSCPPGGLCPPNAWAGWTDYTPPSIQAAGMLNIPVAVFAQPLYRVVQGTVLKQELVALLIGVVVLWSYIGWRVDTCNAAPGPNSTLRIFALILGCAFAVVVLIEAMTMFHAGILYKFIAVSWSALMFRHFVLLIRIPQVVPEADRIGRLPRINLASVAVLWAVFLVAAALLLPPLDSSGTPNASLAHVVAVCAGCLVLVAIYAVLVYLITAWRKAATAPNRASYVVWIGLETGLAVAGVAAMVYIAVHR